MLIPDILRQVSGEISEAACYELETLVKGLPSDALVLDLLPGYGRSTVVLSTAILTHGKSAKILAVDTHIRNPRSARAFEEGTFSVFRASLRTFLCQSPVIPILSPLDQVESFLSKRSINLAVVQVPRDNPEPQHTLALQMKLASYTLRAGGFIAVVQSEHDLFLHKGFEKVDKYTALNVFKLTKGE